MGMRTRLATTLLVTFVLASACADTPATTDRVATPTIQFWQDRVEADPVDAVGRATLGTLAIEQARITGDDTWYLDAEYAFREALTLVPGYGVAKSGLAAALLAQHRFVEGRDLAAEAYASDPRRLEALAAVGDAALSTGDLEAARAAYVELAEREDSARAIARMAHLTELEGDPYRALELALEARATAVADLVGGERMAWYTYRVGDLQRHLGQWSEAEATFNEALSVLPGYPLAIEGLADVAYKTGDYGEALSLLRRLHERSPSAGTATAIGDVLNAAGQVALAQLAYEEGLQFLPVDTELDRRANARDRAELLTVIGRDLDEAVGLAEWDIAERGDVFGYDVLARALLAAGEIPAARAASDRALTLGTLEPGFYVTAASISLAAGDTARAVDELNAALAINPEFDPVDAPWASTLIKENT